MSFTEFDAEASGHVMAASCPARVAVGRACPYMSVMTDNTSTPYTIEISPISKPAGQFQWAIRRNGKLVERSDRPHPTEAKAEASALAAVERSMHSSASGRW